MKLNKLILILLCTIAAILLSSCSGTKNAVANFDELTASHQRIAVIPFHTTITLRPKQRENITTLQLSDMEISQGKAIQGGVESYLIRQNLRVKIQNQGITNTKLKENRIDLKKLLDNDPTKLCRILDVDAIVVGMIETEQPMSNELAMGLDLAKEAVDAYSINLSGVTRKVQTTTNRGSCSLSIVEGQNGDRLWSHEEELSLGAGSTIQDIIDTMMKRGAKKFPYQHVIGYKW